VAEELKLPLATVAKMMNLSPFRAYRASISMKKKREVGVVGRPRALSKGAEEALSQEIVKYSKRGDPVSYATFQAKVQSCMELSRTETNVFRCVYYRQTSYMK
jgi:hypothetical protein